MGQFADLNGDGMSDVVYAFSSNHPGMCSDATCISFYNCVYINTGAGWQLQGDP